MIHNPPAESRTLGADIRALRKARGLTLTELGETLGRSVGWLSQVERDLSEPSITDLRQMAKALDVSVSSLFRSAAPEHELGRIVRSDARRPIGSRTEGLVEALLSPDLTDDFEMLHSTFEPGAILHDEVTRPTQEVGYIASGKMTLWIAGQRFDVAAGDSFRIRGEPYRWENPYAVPCVVIWAIAPPVY
ncbi:helix-turn-helix domain-containing protein [Pseudooctadecabacter jejudonensis]|uniref:HTH-type transcriptional regulator PuuR n=1 Tax=Pseudooctadecabacter jejudonensis TaxID=1391910 RepID=A0A1Y5SDZ1_9RHOB|nr:helix-turn-helix domain-containing protein [Pseudooctadecabacter jejudonensis]SLN35801.1 HTH-type transcriptional regulator PuuR [Pseudooctadecabacter jejudonensis]